MTNFHYNVAKDVGIDQRKYIDLLGSDLELEIKPTGQISLDYITLRYLFFFFKVDNYQIDESCLKQLAIDENPYDVYMSVLRKNNFIVKPTIYKSNDRRLSNGQLLVIFKDDNTPLLLFDNSGFQPKVFDPNLGIISPISSVSNYNIKPQALYVSYSDSSNGQSLTSLLKFASSRLKNNFIILFLTLALAATLGLAYPLILSSLIETAIPQGLTNIVIGLSLFYLLISIAFLISEFAAVFSFIFIDTVLDVRLQTSVFMRLFKMPIEFFKQYRSGDLMARAEAISQIRAILSGSFIDTVVHSSILITSFLVMLIISWKLTILVAIITLLYIISTVFLGILESKQTVEQLRLQGLNIGYIFTALKMVLQFRSEKRQPLLLTQFSTLIFRQLRKSFRAEFYGQTADLIDTILKSFGLFFLFIIGHSLISSTTTSKEIIPFSTGMFVGFISLYSVYVASLYQLTRSLSKNGSTAFALWERAYPIFHESDESRSNEFQFKNKISSIKLNNVHFKYPSQTTYLFEGFDLDVKKGESVNIKGDTASGKTTLIRLILGFQSPHLGSFEINSIDILNLNVDNIRSRFGCIMQTRDILPGTLKDFLLNGGQYKEQHLITILKAIEAYEMYSKYPLGLNTPVAFNGVNFPSDFREVLLLTRSLLSKPDVFIADDSLYSTDLNRIKMIRSYLGDDAIILLVSNRADIVDYCDRSITLQNKFLTT
ncbi:Alpha-hemolysin translocation ATP-binding protein HlyB [Prochlorococcus marinus str. MIT 1313]|uniref:ABC transporter transmembrane domain-containing protein n=1 Tax=Prochlorococcus TaxID=1218 RepID=UPI0007B3A498|nr:ABC transporter ATP-binding protein [Prochlorococcus marinus]KZR69836.1 Alpha-hemolysin translocation ATP-binding protein HlyB [Prochlorococcus marinus str. MIT 1313]